MFRFIHVPSEGIGYKFERRRRATQLAAHPSWSQSTDCDIIAVFDSPRKPSNWLALVSKNFVFVPSEGIEPPLRA